MLKNKKIIITVVILILVAVGVFYYYKHFSYNITTFNGQAIWNDSYAKGLWNRLSYGDVSSVSCQKAIAKYSQENPLNGTNSFDSFYSYKKKRCFGLEAHNFDKDESGYITGHSDKIFDLITGDTLVSCDLYYGRKTDPTTILCNDSQNSWKTSGNDKTPPPFPIYSNTWAALNTFGRE